jgi:hypothetical protein
MATPLGLLSQRDQRLSLAELAQGLQIPLAEAGTDLGGLAERCVRAGGIASVEILQRGGDKQIASLDAVLAAVIEYSSGPGEPSPGGGHVALQQEREAQPEGAAGRSWPIAGTHRLAMRPSPCADTGAVPAGQVGGGGKALEILECEGLFAVRGRQLRVRVRPRLPLEEFMAEGECAGPSHNLSSRASRPRP